jgi:hypothetical protein
MAHARPLEAPYPREFQLSVFFLLLKGPFLSRISQCQHHLHPHCLRTRHDSCFHECRTEPRACLCNVLEVSALVRRAPYAGPLAYTPPRTHQVQVWRTKTGALAQRRARSHIRQSSRQVTQVPLSNCRYYAYATNGT